MTNQTSIKYISTLLDSPGSITDGDQSSISLFRQTFPYFVPVHYLVAFDNHKKTPYASQMLSSMQPYVGDWILFCDFLKAGSSPAGGRPGVNKAEEITHVFSESEPAAFAETTPAHVVTIVEETKEEQAPIPVTVSMEIIEEPEPISAPIVMEEPVVIQEEMVTIEIVAPFVVPEAVIDTEYLKHEDENVPSKPQAHVEKIANSDDISEEDRSLMVMMSFSEWLLHFRNSSEKQKEDNKDQKALRTMWQKEKLAAAMEDEDEEIPESVFEMAVNSISQEEGPVTETLADIYMKQGKYDKAIEMYRKLSLKNPQKNLYFARKIEEALKDKQS